MSSMEMVRRPAAPGHAVVALALALLPGVSRVALADPPAADSTGAATAAAAPADSAVTPEPAPDSAAAAPAPSAAARANAPLASTTKKVRLVREDRNVVRSGPGESYAIVAIVPRHREYTVIAKRGDWYGIRLSDTETGWINASLCKELDDLSSLEFKPNPKLYTRTGSFLLSAYSGAYAFDQKSNSLVAGGRLGYYVFDRLQVEGGLAWTHIRRPAEIVESLFGLSLEAEDFHMLFYHLIGTYELLPGRQMVPFVSGGVGSTILKGDSEPSVNYGAGVTLYLSKHHAMRWEVRDYRFSSGAKNARHRNNNIEFTLGTTQLF